MAVSDHAPPAVRRLRVYAFDPQASTHIDTAAINQAVIRLPWETAWEDKLEPGPTNEYLEVVDIDPVSDQFYRPVDLDDPHLLAQDGLAPSEGDPRFHQQMVFAVAMKTIKAFERALGRKIFWAPKWVPERGGRDGSYQPVHKLRIYPHALREPNAYYSRDKMALLFGYFRASATEPGANLPGGWVFTALSHDIIVHETTHAILDGLHRRYAEPTSVDSIAFHEAFADIVALLSHFTLPEAVADQISSKGGRLSDRTLLSGLARQFGEATGRHAALRDAIDAKGENQAPDPTLLSQLTEPHARGAVLVAAVFDAFVTIYERRTADLMRIARIDAGTGPRSLHPDLVARLTKEAVKAADHMLRMCIRALDYLPPVDVRFGEFLRALVTADTDLVPDDPLNYRLAVIEAFRRRGIVPEKCLSLAPDSLLWEKPSAELTASDLLETERGTPRLQLDPQYRRKDAWKVSERNRAAIWDWLRKSDGQEIDAKWARALGVVFPTTMGDDWKFHTISHWPDRSEVKVEVHSVRTTRRTGPDGQDLRQLVIEITQRRRGFIDPNQQKAQDEGEPIAKEDFIFRGGATLIVDLRNGELRYVIRKSIKDDPTRLEEQRRFIRERLALSLAATYLPKTGPGSPVPLAPAEPFAMAHRGF